MTPGTPINFRPLYGLGLVLAGLCAVLFFACPSIAHHQASKSIAIQHFARLQQPPMLPPSRPQPQQPKPATTPMPARLIPPARVACMLCGEPAERYLKAIQSPFPENRPSYETRTLNLPSAFAYSAARAASPDSNYGQLYPQR
jgi:hypothetical protein